MEAVISRYMTGWGGRVGGHGNVARPSKMDQLRPLGTSSIARGMGRSYGDAAVNTQGHMLLTERLNRILEFNKETGLLRAESGLSLRDLMQISVPQGWFPAVSPGTKDVSLGGCVAADVHGKNHHRDGSFGRHVESIDVILADGTRRTCDRAREPDLFWSTVSGMGLTGIIADVTLRLRRIETARIVQQHFPARNLEQMFSFFEDPAFDDHYTVAWIDGLATGDHLGRGVFMKGHHASRAETPTALSTLERRPNTEQAIPFSFPSWIMNPWTITAFNALYQWSQSRKKQPFFSDFDAFFYPLDRLKHWPRLYGKRGFLQYQCVVPMKNAHAALPLILQLFAASRRASFLAVLKRMGPEEQGLLSFPIDGYTLALDIPAGDLELFPFLDRLDQIVVKNEGRVYLAKDCRMKPDLFKAMYPRHAAWLQTKHKLDPLNRLSSDLSRRLNMAQA